MNATPMTLGLPEGKSLGNTTREILRSAHIGVRRSHERKVSADLDGLPGFRYAAFLKPVLLPAAVSDGTVDVALTGLDTVREGCADVEVCAEFDYSRATDGGTRCVLFERGIYGTGSRGDDALEAFFAKDPGGNPRRNGVHKIVSEYPRETKIFFEDRGLRADIVPVTGGAEALVVLEQYDYGVALVETGTSLMVNDLRELATIFTSKTVLIANKETYADSEKRQYIDFLGKLITGVIDARSKRYVTMNVPESAMENVLSSLPAAKSPTVQRLQNGGASVSSVVPIEGLAELKFRLISLGASDIVEFDHSSIV